MVRHVVDKTSSTFSQSGAVPQLLISSQWTERTQQGRQLAGDVYHGDRTNLTDYPGDRRRERVQHVVETGSARLEHDLARFCETSLDDVYRYAYRLTGGDAALAADLVQDTYVTLVRRMSDPKAEMVDVGWLILTCRHRFLDDVRRATRAKRLLFKLFEPSTFSGIHGTDVGDALGKLNRVQRTAIVLRHIDGLSVGEVAQSIGRSVHATESILRRGLSDLRRIYMNEQMKAAQ